MYSKLNYISHARATNRTTTNKTLTKHKRGIADLPRARATAATKTSIFRSRAFNFIVAYFFFLSFDTTFTNSTFKNIATRIIVTYNLNG